MSKTFIHKAIYVVCLAILPFFEAKCQSNDCLEKLRNATFLYEQNWFDEAIELLTNDIDSCSFSEDDQITIYKLLILSYLSIDDIESADQAAEKIIQIDPYYKPDLSREDIRLGPVFDKFEVIPVFAIGLIGGVNYSSVGVKKYHSIVHANPSSTLSQYNGRIGGGFGISATYRLKERLWINLDVGFSSGSYEHELLEIEGETVSYQEELSFINLPLTVKYEMTQGPWLPYIEAGVGASFMTKSLSTTSRADVADLSDRLFIRNTFNMNGLIGAGISYYKNQYTISAGLSYIRPFMLSNDGTRRYDDEINVFKYYYVDDDFRLNFFQGQITISQIIRYKTIHNIESN